MCFLLCKKEVIKQQLCFYFVKHCSRFWMKTSFWGWLFKLFLIGAFYQFAHLLEFTLNCLPNCWFMFLSVQLEKKMNCLENCCHLGWSSCLHSFARLQTILKKMNVPLYHCCCYFKKNLDCVRIIYLAI